VFHRIDDPDTLTIPQFLAKTVRLSAYEGALRARFAQQPTGAAASTSVDVPATGAPIAGGGDTPPEVVQQLKAAQFAARHTRPGGQVYTPADIEWNDDKVFRELVKK
jgi:hypothetical protein